MDKVLHINDYPIDSGGGAEVVMQQTIALLRSRGIEVDTYTSANLADARRGPWRYVDNRCARQALAAKLDVFRPAVVHLHNFYHILSPGILATLAEYQQQHPLRVVMTAHDYHLVSPNSGGSWFHWWSRQREAIEPHLSESLSSLVTHRWDDRTCLHSFLKLAQHVWNYRWHHRRKVIDVVICPSRFVQSMLVSTGLTTAFLPHPVPSAPGLPRLREGPLRFVFAGRLESEKGLNEFLQMLPSDFDAALTIIGAGTESANCQATCVARGWSGRVEFAGRLSHAETLARIASCHVLIQPSRVLETYGLTLIEALSRGANVLAANRGAAREIIDAAGVGFLFDPDDATSLSCQLQAIRTQYAEGVLNQFDVTAFLEARSEARYLDGLMHVYHDHGPSR